MTGPTPTHSTTLELPGIDGANPVGLLAALGALSLATDGLEGDLRLRWKAEGARWIPCVTAGRELTDQGFVEAIVTAQSARDLDAELGWGSDIMKLTRDDVRRLVASGLEPGRDRAAEMIAACLSELPPRRPKEDLASYTPFRVIPRVGRARFLATALSLSEAEGSGMAMREALFQQWQYRKANNLRWDPAAKVAARAYTAEAPTHFGPLGVPGAMLLAVAGLRFFPLMASRRSMLARPRAACRGFGHSRGQVLVWPVWDQPLSESGVRLLLGLPELYEPVPNLAVLRRHGVAVRMVATRERIGDDDEVLSWGEPRALTEAEAKA